MAQPNGHMRTVRVSGYGPSPYHPYQQPTPEQFYPPYHSQPQYNLPQLYQHPTFQYQQLLHQRTQPLRHTHQPHRLR